MATEVIGKASPATGNELAKETTLTDIKDTSGIKKITDPVAVTDNGGSLTVDGPLTDAELRASVVPVSVASIPLPTGAATEATLALVATEVKLEAVRVLLASLDGKDFSTQTTLASILVDTGQIEALLATIDADTSALAAFDFATGTVQTDGTQKAIARSGDKGTAVAADITSTPFDVNTEALHTDEIDSRLLRERDKLVTANYAKEAVVATTYYILVDLDGVPYPHDETGARLIMAGAASQGFKSNVGAKWAVQIGVIMTIDGTDAKIAWLPIASLTLRDTSRFSGGQHLPLFPDYVDLAQAAGVFTKIASNLYESGVTAVNTGITLEDALGNSVTPAVGDMLLRAELISGSGSLDFKFAVQYWAE